MKRQYNRKERRSKQSMKTMSVVSFVKMKKSSMLSTLTVMRVMSGNSVMKKMKMNATVNLCMILHLTQLTKCCTWATTYKNCNSKIQTSTSTCLSKFLLKWTDSMPQCSTHRTYNNNKSNSKIVQRHSERESQFL